MKTRLLEDWATRAVYSTDNSIYQVRPSGVALPQTADDVVDLLSANHASSSPKPVVARGGGTGTNGQSLTDGISIDVKRHLDRIIDIDVEARRVVVEPGCVTARLNAELAPHGLFWPPHTSTLNRATVGGMISTDAAGKGSLVHGRTHRHVESVEMVLEDGTRFIAEPVAEDEARRRAESDDTTGRLWSQLIEIADACDAAELDLPELARGFSGYGIDRLRRDGVIDPVALVCGAEGTLGVITRATLSLVPIPAETVLVVASYSSFADALDDAVDLAPLTRPDAIESFDETTLERGRSSPAWPALGSVVGEHRGSVLLLEYSGETVPDTAPVLAALRRTGRHIAARVITDPAERSAAWKVRADAVGLLAKVATGGPELSARPTAFVEDCAVPVARMTSFIAGFREILDEAGVTYGMFGHADVGCVHVRPALDLTDERHRSLVSDITESVVELVGQHGGVLWGEHGRGFRGDSVEAFLSAPTIDLMRRVKTAFDPLDRCNPGKLYRPVGTTAPLVGIVEPTLRGEFDARVGSSARSTYADAFACNGNGLCQHYAGTEVMCPSFKASGDPALSPKGRADLIRAWLHDGQESPETGDAVAANLDQCLSCSACSGRCPVEVDIPELKSRFFERYYENRRRPLSHALLGRFEDIAMRMARVPALGGLRARVTDVGARAAGAALGLVDLPAPSPLIDHEAPVFEPGRGTPDVVIVPDVFTAGIEPATLAHAVSVLHSIDLDVAVSRFVPSGKFDHVKGRRRAFAAAVADQRAVVESIVASGATPVVIEPAVALLHGHEYQTVDADHPGDAVLHLVDVLFGHRDRLAQASSPRDAVLFAHCTERATRPTSLERWRVVLEAVGHSVVTPDLGCCGMAGIFGHEAANQAMSRQLWDLTWRPELDDMALGAVAVATGFSCRSQAKRFDRLLAHPVTLL